MPLNPRIDDWRGRVCWLLGASTGIGRATASRLHALGARVIATAGSADKCERALELGASAVCNNRRSTRASTCSSWR